MSLSNGEWLYTELERAAAEYRGIPEWAKPVVTVPRAEVDPTPTRRIGFQVQDDTNK